MKYIVYCTRNNKNSKIYVGVHQTIDPFSFDGYLGCGIYTHSKTIKATTAFQSAIKKYGADNFTRITLGVFSSEAEAYRLEETIVTKEFVRRKDTYNMMVGGNKAFYCNPERPVCRYSIDGKLEEEYDSLENASIDISTDIFEIAKACTTCGVTLMGSIWRYPTHSKIELVDIDHIVGTKSKELPVMQYSKAGYKIKEWDSIQSAAKALNCDKSSISSSCKGDPSRKITGGYQWRYASDNLDSVEPANTSGGERKKIVRLSPDGVLMEVYNSIAEAEEKFGLSKVSIHKALKTNKVSGGFRWQYV